MHQDKIARYSRYLIYFILAVLPLERIPSLELTSPLSLTVRLSQVAGLALILINLPLMWRSRDQLRRAPWVWLTAFVGICALSTGLALDLKRAVMVLGFTGFVAVLAWVVALRFERERLDTYLRIIIWSALATCAFGFYQFFGDLLGLPADWTGLREMYTKEVFGFPRIQSTGLEPLYFGDYLLIPAGLLVAAVLNGWRRWLATVALVPIATLVWLTVSRGAMVALAVILLVGLGVGVARRQWNELGRLVAVTAVSVGLAYGLLYLGTHVVTQKNEQTAHAIETFSKQTTNISNGESSEGRAITRKLALEAFASQPLTGIGPGNFGSYAARAMPDRFSGNGAIVNNEPLEVLAETGLAGLVALGGFVVTLLWQVLRLAKQRAVERVLGYGGALALLGIMLQYQTFSTLYITHIWVLIGLLGGLIGMAVVADKTKAKA